MFKILLSGSMDMSTFGVNESNQYTGHQATSNQRVNLGYVNVDQQSGKKGKYPCRYCGKLIRNKFDLSIHERSHTGERPFVCPVCNKGCSTKSNLKAHAVVHIKPDNF
jgi:uncharacterized Zn-finger protein